MTEDNKRQDDWIEKLKMECDVADDDVLIPGRSRLFKSLFGSKSFSVNQI